jgi:hypothetical protein
MRSPARPAGAAAAGGAPASPQALALAVDASFSSGAHEAARSPRASIYEDDFTEVGALAPMPAPAALAAGSPARAAAPAAAARAPASPGAQAVQVDASFTGAAGGAGGEGEEAAAEEEGGEVAPPPRRPVSIYEDTF